MIVHVNRLKLYPSPTKNSVRKVLEEEEDKENTQQGGESSEDEEGGPKITSQLCQLVKLLGKKSKSSTTKKNMNGDGEGAMPTTGEIEIENAVPAELIRLSKQVNKLMKTSKSTEGEGKRSSAQTTPPPTVTDSETEKPQTETEKQKIIVDHRRRNQKLEYLVRGMNEPVAMATWIRGTDITDKELIERYTSNRIYPTTRSRTVIRPSVNVLSTKGKDLPDATKSPLSIWSLVVIFLLVVRLLAGSPVPKLGALYNCEETKYTGVYTLPKELTCDELKATPSKINSFEALIKQYHPKTTQIPIYHCTAFKVTITCKNIFFEEKHRHVEEVRVTAEECLRAVRYKMFRNVRLRNLRPGVWGNDPHKNYNCAWLSAKTNRYLDMRMAVYTGSLEGADTRLHNDLTNSVCQYKKRYCVPREQPNSILAWERSQHAFKIYRPMGVHPVKQLNSFFLIPNLAIGGTVVSETKNAYLLDTGYQVIRRNNGTFHVPLAFQNYSDNTLKTLSQTPNGILRKGKLRVGSCMNLK